MFSSSDMRLLRVSKGEGHFSHYEINTIHFTYVPDLTVCFTSAY